MPDLTFTSSGNLSALRAATAFTSTVHHQHAHCRCCRRFASHCCGQRKFTPMTRTRHERPLCERMFGSLPPGYTLRQHVSIVLSGTPAGWAWDLFQTVLTVVACALYVVSSYDVTVDLVSGCFVMRANGYVCARVRACVCVSVCCVCACVWPPQRCPTIPHRRSTAGFPFFSQSTTSSVGGCILPLVFVPVLPLLVDMLCPHHLVCRYASENRLAYPFGFFALVDFFTIIPVYMEIFWSGGLPQLAFLRFVRVLRVMRVLRAFKILNSTMTGQYMRGWWF